MKTLLKLQIILAFLMTLNYYVQAENQPSGSRQAILLTAFGTTVPEANTAYQNIEEEFRKAFPTTEIRWAYTSEFIRKKLRKQGNTVHSPAMALSALAEDGYRQVFVQSLHIIPGKEYHDLLDMAYRFDQMPEGIEKIVVADPLLTSDADMRSVTKAMAGNLPKERKDSEAVIFMGHGSHHPANIYYPGMQYYLWNEDDCLFVGTVEGTPDLESILPKLDKQHVEKVWLSPLMAVAGDHAKNDMAGDEPQSWKSMLEAKGYQVNTILEGMAERDNIVSVWIRHLKQKMTKN